MARRSPNYAHWPALAIALGGAFVLIHWWRLERPLWVDEEMIALNTRWRSFAELAGPLWLDQSAPVGWLVLERLALVLFGTDERAARAVPVLFGLAMLAVAVWVGRRWMTPVGAAVLAALCAIGPWIVFFTLELKQYSADTCGALLLPALAAWALEGESGERVIRRIRVWWVVAAAGLWLANGATFVAPGCAALLVCWTWYRYGLRAAAAAATPSAVWLVSFGLHYLIGLRHALGNEYLANYWRFAFPPVSEGPREVLSWLTRWLESFALKPVGTSHPAMFWAAVAGGLIYAAARRGAGAIAFALVPVSAVALGILQVVPPFERLGLWCVPALYVALAWGADAGVWAIAEWRRDSFLVRLIAAAAAFYVVATVTHQIVLNGRSELGAKGADNNYLLDDRSAARRVMGLRQPGDPILTTHFGLAGLWWYAGVDVGDERRGGYLDDNPVFEISYEPRASRCARHRAALDELFTRTGRVIVSLGFRMNVEPPDFDRLVMDELGRRGGVVGYRRYSDLSHVAAFDRREAPGGSSERFFQHMGPPAEPPLKGCVAVRPAMRW